MKRKYYTSKGLQTRTQNLKIKRKQLVNREREQHAEQAIDAYLEQLELETA